MLKSKTSARMLTLAGATALILGATSSSQADTATSNVAVTATVAAHCTISTTTAIAFGAYDPVTANATADIEEDGALSVACTTGSVVSVTLSQGGSASGTSTATDPDRRMTDGAGTPHYLQYTLYSDSGRQNEWTADTGISYTGTGAAEPIPVYATLPAGQNVPVGSYSDTVVATVTF